MENAEANSQEFVFEGTVPGFLWFQAAVHGIGIALLPEQVISAPLKERLVERVLPEWSGAKNILHLVYPTPRGMLPSVRSLIDYLLIYVPAWLRERGI